MENKYIDDLIKIMKESGESADSIANACKYAENLLTLQLPVIFNEEHFALLIGKNYHEFVGMMATIDTHYYHEVEIAKKSGGVRILNIPAVSLRVIQKWILKNILETIHISDKAMGFCINKSILTNAKIHVGKKCIISIDLHDFFTSIKSKQIFNVFYYYGYTINVSYVLAKLCTFEGYLPQGAPTSPYLSNIVCLKLDKRLSGVAKKYNADYSRYADDITFSGNTDISGILPVVNRIIHDEGFAINDKKTRVSFYYQKQEVTGLLVNDNHVHVNRKYLKKLKQEIYYCKKYGVEDHLSHIGSIKKFYKDHLYGKAYFVKMINEELGRKLIDELDQINWD